jgi:gamma-glutamyl:cysteine ligase YbdK (ATP-grasp superfamily)
MPSFHLFERHGVEMEYMIVDAATLDVSPIADKLLEEASGEAGASDAEFGRIGWSNELVRHVIEFKCAEPEASLDGLDALFQAEVARAEGMLAKWGCRLLPTGMHPWMDPHTQTVLWPHGNKEIYNAFDRVFNCKGHGWSNLQSTHINLPFAGDGEFHRLHSAIRTILPLLPALSASTPFADGRAGTALDTRLDTYRRNCARVPSITAGVVPELIASEAEYREKILERIYRDIAPLDPEGILRDEWLNARGAIARFCRNTIEIRVIDLQECPRADMAIVQMVVCAVRALAEGRLSDLALQDAAVQAELEAVFFACMKDAGWAHLDAPTLFAAIGMPGRIAQARDVWAYLLEKCAPAQAPWRGTIAAIIRHGTLARRIRKAAGDTPDRETLRQVYTRLADCLRNDRTFEA